VIRVTINSIDYFATVAADGTWSLVVEDTVPDGEYSYSVSATDVAGNEANATGSITIDTVTTLTADLVASSDTGVFDNDGITQDTTPSFTGTGEVGASIVLSIDGDIYSGVVDANGRWDIDVDNSLADGEHSYEVVSTDTAGNTASLNGSIEVDTLAPSFTGGLGSDSDSAITDDNITNVTQPTFSGSGEAGATVVLTIAEQSYTTTIDAGGNWQLNVSDTLADGNYPYTLVATDTAGNVSSLSNSIDVDTSTVLTGRLSEGSDTGVSNNDGVTQVTTPDFNGTGEVGAAIVLTINNNTYTATVGVDGLWAINVSDVLPDGRHDFQIVATDIAGNQSSVTDSIDVDTSTTVSATLALSSDSGVSNVDGITNIQTPVFSGTAEPGVNIVLAINNQTYTGTANATIP